MRKFLTFFISILLFSLSVTAQNVSLNNGKLGYEVNVLSSTPESTILEYNFFGYQQKTKKLADEDYLELSAPGMIVLMEKGLPQLPSMKNSIIIPNMSNVNFRILENEEVTLTTKPIMPSKGHITRNIDPDTIPYEFDKYYTSDSWYPQSNITLSDPYIVRELRGTTVEFNPLRYNHTLQQLRVSKKLVVEIYSDNSDRVINPLTTSDSQNEITEDFRTIYNTLFLNFNKGSYEYEPIPEPGRLLIIYHNSYSNEVEPFYQWKLGKGIPTLKASYPDETGTGSGAIKTYIQNLYNSPEGLTYIILIGESYQIPTLYGLSEGAASDPCYTKLAGTDAYPDAFISRISVTSTAQCDYVLNKIKKYEEEPFSGPQSAWYLKGAGVASNEGSPPDYQRAGWLKDMLIDNMFFTQVDNIYDPGATSSMVTTSLNEGRSIVNYIGHGSGTSWSTTGFNVTAIHALSNGYKNPFIIDVACVNGDFELSECMEEAWLRAGSESDPKGAIAAFGASTNASWVPPCDMQNHSVELLSNRVKQTVGGVTIAGVMHAMDLWGGSGGEGLKLMEQFHIFGDCTTLLTFGLIPDSTAPEPVTDLTVSNVTSNSFTLNWTAPLDSSLNGVTSYDIRCAEFPILNDNDFNNAASVIFPGMPDSAGMLKTYTMQNLNFSTQYYLAIKAMDIWSNISTMSNVAVETTFDAPEISASPNSFDHIVQPNTIASDTIHISNISASNSTLDYSVELANNTFPGRTNSSLKIISASSENTADKNKPDEFNVGSIEGSGGPDLFGYEWIDSNDPNGPVYLWDDISTTGTELTNWIASSSFNAKDEGYAGPVDIGFDFKFYGEIKSSIYVGSNGFVAFAPIDQSSFTNDPIPDSGFPNEIISPFWDDLDGKTTGKVFYKQESTRLIIQYQNWLRYSGTGDYTFQIVLNKNGKINFYYNTMTGTLNGATVGIENADGTDGLEIAQNSAYAANQLAVQLMAEPDWLSANHSSGTLYNGSSAMLIMTYDCDGLEFGNYGIDIVINSNDPLNPEITVPISLVISNEVPVELTSFSAEVVNSSIVLNWQTATETNNSGYEIERSIGSDKSWEMIGFVPGRGTTTEISKYSFEDEASNLKSKTLKYRLKQIDFDGQFSFSDEVEINVLPVEFSLEQNYPNPFNPSTTIKFSLPEQSNVKIEIFNSIGQVADLLVNDNLEAGYYSLDYTPNNFASGIYYYRMQAKDFVSIKKFVLIK